MRYTGRIALFVLALVTFLFPGMPEATIYMWQDAEGNTHFTDDLTRVPSPYREGAEVETLPEETVNVAPAPPPPAETPENEPTPPVDRYAECQKKVQKERERWTVQLEEDQDRLVELNRLIHRSVISRRKSEYQRERVAVKERIAQSEQALRERLPVLEEECEAIRYWQVEE